MRRRRLGWLVATVVATSVILGFDPAHAASVAFAPVTRVWAGSIQRSCSGPVVVTPVGDTNGSGKYTSVAVTGLTGSCTTGGIAVALSGGSMLVNPGTTATVSGGSFSVPTLVTYGASSVDPRVFVSGDTWPVKATWMPSIYGGCIVQVVATGASTTKACSVTTLSAVVSGNTAGTRTAAMSLQISAPTMDPATERAYLLLNLGPASGLSNGNGANKWLWSNAGVKASTTTPTLSAYPGSACSALPMLQAYAPGSSSGATITFTAMENRTGVSGLLCS